MKLKIIFCDDDAVFLNYLRERTGEILSGMGVETEDGGLQLRGGTDGRAARSTGRRRGGCRFFWNIDMPGMSGFEAAEMLRDLPGKAAGSFCHGYGRSRLRCVFLSAFLVS